jgi:fibronectin type 3 domain-containing protein
MGMKLCNAQEAPYKNCIQVVGRPSVDSVMLRWAPLTSARWQAANKHGYVIERFTLVRNGQVLNPVEVTSLTQTPLKPLPVEHWEPLVKNDRYAAITAQALYGSSFDVDMGKSDVFQIVNKAKENEQRFQFALFSADMSLAVAKASGLLYTDHQVKPNEKYLYRISINAPQDTCRGSLYISPTDVYKLPVITELKAERKGETVMLQWQADKMNFYTAYRVERSADGKMFTKISNEAVINFSPTEKENSNMIFTSDSVKSSDSRLWYRVVGITAFGEYGPVEESVETILTETISDVPYINNGINEDNTKVSLHWSFPEKLASEIKGFHIDRANTPKGNYNRLTTKLLTADKRTFTDTSPQRTNYYKVIAITPKGRELASPVYLVQLVDSIPPLPPKGLQAKVDEYGNISLQWQPNTEADIYGYRIYRAHYKSEEFFQVTSEPVIKPNLADKIDLKTLTKKIYYKVMAIDKSQNHSALSEIIEVKLPDKVKPVSPVMMPVKSTDEGIELHWQPSSSEDVVRYEVYRQPAGEKQWMRVFTIQAKGDSVYRYSDTNLLSNRYNYTVVAVDDSGLESEPAQAVVGSRIDRKLKPAVKFSEPVINRENKEVILTWTYELPAVKSYMIFKSIGDEQPVLYKTIPATSKQFTDKPLVAGEQYRYRVMALFENHSKSELSKELIITF